MSKKFKEFELQLPTEIIKKWLDDAPTERSLRTAYLMIRAAEAGANEMMHHICGELDTPEHSDLLTKVLDVWPKRRTRPENFLG